MTDAETSAYLLMAAGLVWVLVGIVGLVRRQEPPVDRDRAEVEEMTKRLQKFVERGAYGEGRGRTAYLLDSGALPQAADGMDWHQVDSFNADDELLNDPGLKAVFKTAIDDGCATVTAPFPSVLDSRD